MSLRVVFVPRGLGIPRRYLVSAAAHGVLLAAWVFAPSRTTVFRPMGDAMEVGLVAAPPSGGGARTVPPPAPTPVAPPPEPAGPSLQPEPEPKPPDKKDKKKEDKKPPEPTPSRSPATGPSASPPQAPTGASTPGGSGAPGTTLSIGGGEAGSDFYSASVRSAIEPRWRKPVLDSDVPSEVTVGFEILRDGTVRDVQVVTPSGIPALDRSALRAVIEASPLPPFPAGWRGASTPARMTFILLPE